MSLRPTVLTHPRHSLPPSLPLILERDHEWDWEKKQLVLCPEKATGPPLKVLKEALEVLGSVDKPIAVLSICGPYRSGKSYLFSSILGSPGAFEVAPSMSACTKGVWMATTVLECEEFAVVLLDTEGMDSVDEEDEANKTDLINKMLMVTTVLSSVLIYNSKSVPEWSDLEDLSCFSQLSSSILSKSTEEYDNVSSNFPEFMWLIRDAHLQLTIDCKPVNPTEYLKAKVLRRSKNAEPTQEDHVVSAILRLFPAITCHTLPRPSADPKISSALGNKEIADRVDECFKKELQDLISHIKGRLRVKNLCDKDCSSGTMLGELVTRFVHLVSRDDELALTSTYITAAESALEKLSVKLVEEYRSEMEQRLEGRYPLEEYSTATGDSGNEATLLSIHEEVLKPKQEKYEGQVNYLLSVSGEEDSSVQKKQESAVLKFLNAIRRLSKEGDSVKIEDGALHRFAMKNQQASRQQCRDLSLQVFKRVREAIHSPKTDISTSNLPDLLQEAERRYFAEAVGPAKDEVYREVRRDLDNSCEEVATTIPGKPMDVSAIGQTKNKIKLQWNGTGCTTDVKYEVQTMHGHETWTIYPERFTEEFGIISKLKSHTDYNFQVRGMGKTGRFGEWSDTCRCSTTLGAMARGMATVGTFVGGLVSAPVGATVALPIFGPVATLGGLAGAPILAGIWAKKVHERFGPQGELKDSGAAGGVDGERSSNADSASDARGERSENEPAINEEFGDDRDFDDRELH